MDKTLFCYEKLTTAITETYYSVRSKTRGYVLVMFFFAWQRLDADEKFIDLNLKGATDFQCFLLYF